MNKKVLMVCLVHRGHASRCRAQGVDRHVGEWLPHRREAKVGVRRRHDDDLERRSIVGNHFNHRAIDVDVQPQRLAGRQPKGRCHVAGQQTDWTDWLRCVAVKEKVAARPVVCDPDRTPEERKANDGT